jgi:hypothetical protein
MADDLAKARRVIAAERGQRIRAEGALRKAELDVKRLRRIIGVLYLKLAKGEDADGRASASTAAETRRGA